MHQSETSPQLPLDSRAAEANHTRKMTPTCIIVMHSGLLSLLGKKQLHNQTKQTNSEFWFSVTSLWNFRHSMPKSNKTNTCHEHESHDDQNYNPYRWGWSDMFGQIWFDNLIRFDSVWPPFLPDFKPWMPRMPNWQTFGPGFNSEGISTLDTSDPWP